VSGTAFISINFFLPACSEKSDIEMGEFWAERRKFVCVVELCSASDLLQYLYGENERATLLSRVSILHFAFCLFIGSTFSEGSEMKIVIEGVTLRGCIRDLLLRQLY
jgi:hypothetical protein